MHAILCRTRNTEACQNLTGQFSFTLLNPAIALVLATTFFILWRKRLQRPHLGLLAFAFFACGLAFVAQDFLAPLEGPVLRIAANGLFFVAIVAACAAALTRAHIAVPAKLIGLISLCAAAAFLWYLLADPSTTARIYVMNAAYAAFAAITAQRLVAAGPRALVDWLAVLTMVFLFLLAVSRPIATLLQGLDVNADGSFQQSAYWATVQAFTPLLALAIALVFLGALAVEVVGELREQADIDYLTGLLNRRGFDARAVQALDAAEPRLVQPAVMLIDIDDFKKINDSHGHASGDEVIRAVGSVLARSAGKTLVARTGGEEFALFYADVRRGDLMALADAIRASLAQTAIAALPAHHRVTVSIGIHTRHQSEPLTAMMAQADQALYAAKKAGKDRAAIAPLPLRTVIEAPARLAR